MTEEETEIDAMVHRSKKRNTAQVPLSPGAGSSVGDAGGGVGVRARISPSGIPAPQLFRYEIPDFI